MQGSELRSLASGSGGDGKVNLSGVYLAGTGCIAHPPQDSASRLPPNQHAPFLAHPQGKL